jgi:peptidoglycan/xylan/chitin deacetylase (PgdA/CDA1 family)
MGWARDFWDPFDWYLQVEEGLPATYFLIPFKGRAGEHIPSQNASRRATAYDITDLPEWTKTLQKKGCELGVHGIDSWHNAEKGREELVRIASVTGESEIGIRMHWLLQDQNTFRVLEEAGYAYDSTAGYNDTIGYRNGTSQVFRPFGTRTLLELPMHIQDGAMFYPQKLDLSESEAWIRCGELIDNAGQFGGCLTVLWHDRSHGPERYWGDFYARFVHKLKSMQGWFGTARQTVNWFRKRREVSFVPVAAADGNARVCLRYGGEEISPPLKIRVHNPCGPPDDSDSHATTRPLFADIAWNGTNSDEFERTLEKVYEGLECSRESDSPVQASKFRDQRGFSTHFQS